MPEKTIKIMSWNVEHFKMDKTKKIGEKLFRISCNEARKTKSYLLEMPIHQQACELITAWALSRTKNKEMQRLLKALLYRFTARQKGLQKSLHFFVFCPA